MPVRKSLLLDYWNQTGILLLVIHSIHDQGHTAFRNEHMNAGSQRSQSSLNYPRRGSLDWLIYKTPLVLWRMGFGRYFCHPSRGGSRMLVLTTSGRKSGLARHTMLSHAQVGRKDYVCSGWGSRSDWTRNLQHNPRVTVQSWRVCYPAQARSVTDLEEFTDVATEMFRTGGDSHFKSWLGSLGIAYSLEDMIAKRDRLMILGFDPVEGEGPDPLQADLAWIPPALAVLAGILIWLALRGRG